MKILLTLFLLLSSAVFASSVHIQNDSPFKLTAIILSADGKNLGEVTINPQNKMTWHDSYSGTSQYSETPYTVIFRCPEGAEYGIWTEVPPGGIATAQGSSGPRICRIPKKQKDSTPGSSTTY
ncbi:MAG: hypothetical protein KAR79_04925 [Simkaniaceae bacterium]|nr:hypothetical protein [Simkaniaceae bacterium]